MSWEDQGRQEHGWFGHGTAPPKDKGEGTSNERSGPDGAYSADTAAARAYAWAKTYGPVLFGFPRGGAVLEEFAGEARHIEQATPGSLARTLDRWAAQGKFGIQAKAVRDGLLTLASDDPGERSPGGSPQGRPVVGGVPGRGQPNKAWNESINEDPHSLAGKSVEEIVKAFTDDGYPVTIRPSGRGSQRASIIEIGGGSRVSQVKVHPGLGRHGGAYTEFSTDHGKLKYIDPTTYERTGPEKASTKFFDARTGAPIDGSNLRIRGSGGAVPGGSGGPLGSPDVPLEGEPPGTIRPPLGGVGSSSIPGTTPRPAEEE